MTHTNKIGTIQAWLAQTRANFLLLAVFLVAIGLAYSAKYNPGVSFNWMHAILIAAGTISAHVAVNLFNELSDYYTGIDFNTKRTPFSGGSGMMTSGYLKPRQVKIAAAITLVFSGGIGLYFSLVSHWSIALISVIGAFTIVFYTRLLSRMSLGELFAGLVLGSLVVLGAFIAQSGSPGMALSTLIPPEVWLISLPPGILTAMLLLLNEFPDTEADRGGGRNHLVIKLGKKRSAKLYAASMMFVFLFILLLPLLGIASPWLYLALLPFPLAVKTSLTAIRHGEQTPKLLPALGMNVMVVLGTDLLIALAVIIQI
ncbi:MAG: prenyltransferase [Bacteroidales bacterium]